MLYFIAAIFVGYFIISSELGVRFLTMITETIAQMILFIPFMVMAYCFMVYVLKV